MYIDEQVAQQAHAFFEELKREVVRQANDMNTKHDGDLQDGYALLHIEDGWVSYKGYSWGFVVRLDKLEIDMTFGPDWPFVGHRSVFVAESSPSGINWVEQNGKTTMRTAEQMARFGLQRLAAKVHDENLFEQYHPGIAAEQAAELY